MTRVARLVAQLPVTAAAWADGRLSTGQVETICSFLTDPTVEVFARHEHAIVPVLEPLIGGRRGGGHAGVAGPPRWPRPRPQRPLVVARLAHLGRPGPGRRRPRRRHRRTAVRPPCGWLMQAAPDTEGEPVRVPAQRRADALGRHLPVLPRPPRRGERGATPPTPPEPGVRHGPRPRRHRVHHRRRPHHRRVPRRRGHRRPATCATASSTGSSCGASPPSWTTDAPPGPCPHRCGTSCCSATSTAAGKAATAPAPGAKPTTSSGGRQRRHHRHRQPRPPLHQAPPHRPPARLDHRD